MNRLKELTKGLEEIVKNLRVEGDFREKFLNIVKLAQSPFVKSIVAGFNIDLKILDVIFDALLNDKQVLDIVGTIANIFECFSVDRFIGVETEDELEDMAVKLNEKKLFLAGIYFEDVGQSSTDLSYKLRMDIDNTPITLENRNRFWFPGPDASFELQMRYHRGFIQIQHVIDKAITKSLVREENKRLKELYEIERAATEAQTTVATEFPSLESEDAESSSNSSELTFVERLASNEAENLALQNKNGSDVRSAQVLESTETIEPKFEETTEVLSTASPYSSKAIEANAENGDSSRLHQLHQNITSHLNATQLELKLSSDDDSDELIDESEKPKNATEDDILKRKKRSPQLGGIFDMLLGGSKGAVEKTPREDDFPGALKMPEFEVFTKQFPYSKYRKDSFKTGLYLAQSVQLAFFFALIVQVSVAVRNRIWMRESGNSTVSYNYLRA